MSWKRIRLTVARSRDFCSVHRFWEGEGDALGRLRRERGGHWTIVYDPGGPAEEPIHRFAQHRLVEGEYLSTRDHAGGEHVLRVVSVRPEPGLGGKP
jgi:hypothetical protein